VHFLSGGYKNILSPLQGLLVFLLSFTQPDAALGLGYHILPFQGGGNHDPFTFAQGDGCATLLGVVFVAVSMDVVLFAEVCEPFVERGLFLPLANSPWVLYHKDEYQEM
jgi:hypothetical protein